VNTTVVDATDHVDSSGVDRPPSNGSEPEKPAGRPLNKLRPHNYRSAFVYVLYSLAALIVIAFGILVGYYFHYARLADSKLKAGPFSTIESIYAAPETLRTGEPLGVADVVAMLRDGGADGTADNPGGWFRVSDASVEYHPGTDAMSGQPPVVVRIAKGKIDEIRNLNDGSKLQQYVLEPPLITGVTEKSREKRRLVKFRDIPPSLVQAVISAEDKRFFQHSGFDPFRILKAAWVDFRSGRKEQGASTLSMQLARNFWLDSDKSWRRKFAETLITMRLEEKLSKEQIFEDYANQVYLGRVGTYSINGFGAAAQAYFGKDIRQLSVPEAALIAALIQRPSYYNPLRNPDRAVERRNLVLGLMRQNGYLSEAGYQSAKAIPLTLSSKDGEAAEAPYFVDLTNDEMQGNIAEGEGNHPRVYTTVDLNLQRVALEAVRIGMQNVDKLLRKPHRRKATLPPAEAQVALVAIDPHTGDVKALIGGRNYAASQLNRALAKRQPGSAFKPFVYAAALDTAVEGGPEILTPASTVMDQPTTFEFGNKEYTPGNFGQEYYGQVTLRSALAHSMNIATIKVAQMVGYDSVVRVARRARLNAEPTPSVALGSYEDTPLEVAGAYTVFANQGVYVKPHLISSIRAQNGSEIYSYQPETQVALDPRVAYLMVNMLEEVLRSGTGAGVRAKGFNVPAAGKTGTSRDGWFAGFTSNLLCVVWVGFDDNRELGLEGAKSALPIWTEFMKRALAYYPDARPFPRPNGITSAQICPESGQLASSFCPSTRSEVFIAGSQPESFCNMHANAEPQIAGADGGVLVEPSAAPANGQGQMLH
jgi:penicillin-binding protein 1B